MVKIVDASLIILAGGRGSRLGSISKTVSKPILLVQDKPRVSHVIQNLCKPGVKTFNIYVGHHADKVISTLNGFDWGCGVSLTFHLDKTLYGIGGAIYNVVRKLAGNCVVLKGDSFVADLDLKKLLNFHMNEDFTVTLSATNVIDASRFGTLKTNGSKVLSFLEKGVIGAGLINAGVYIFDPKSLPKSNQNFFSFEKDVVCKLMKEEYVGSVSKRPFIDIWIESNLKMAEHYYWSN